MDGACRGRRIRGTRSAPRAHLQVRCPVQLSRIATGSYYGSAVADELNLGQLGPGWEQAERALAAVQRDLSDTVADAPTLVLLWRDVPAETARPGEPRTRWAYVGKGVDWYFGANGGFRLSGDYSCPRCFRSLVRRQTRSRTPCSATTRFGRTARTTTEPPRTPTPTVKAGGSALTKGKASRLSVNSPKPRAKGDRRGPSEAKPR